MWRRYTIPEPGEPGSETWLQDSNAWMFGGGPTWRSGAYDPQLDLVYWGTGNAEPYDPRPRGTLDSLYTSSVLAIRPKTGEIACFYQYTPNDVYDVDGTDEHVLADLQIGGQSRKVMIQANKNGFLYVLDRTNCELIAANPYVRVNWVTHIDLETGRPVLTDLTRSLSPVRRSRSGRRAARTPCPSHSIQTPVWATRVAGTCHAYRSLRRQKSRFIGASSTGVVNRFPQVEPGGSTGSLRGDQSADRREEMGGPADRLSELGRHAGDRERPPVHWKMTGEFIVLDEATGETLWEFKTGSSINSTAITYTHNGRQYVTVASGLGGSLANRYARGLVPTGGSVWTFALMPE